MSQTVINPFTGREIIVGGRTYKFVEKRLLDWLEDGCEDGPDPNAPKYYCGPRDQVPPGYVRRGTQYECLKKGFGTGKCEVYRKFRSG
jgi:hypothetical protein